MPTVCEIIARAIYEEGATVVVPSWDDLELEVKDHLFDRALAIGEALRAANLKIVAREPTKAMERAAVSPIPVTDWGCMFDAAPDLLYSDF